MIQPNCNFLKKIYKLISCDKKNLKFNIPPTLGLQIIKLSPGNLIVNGFLAVPKSYPNFPRIFSLILLNFQ
jgi:hypothetical protein